MYKRQVETGTVATACVDLLECNTVSWTAGTFDSETSWTLADMSGAAGSGTGDFGACAGCEYPASMPATSNTGVNGWFSFVMDAAGSASVNVDAVTDFPDFIVATVYSDCDGSIADAAALEIGSYLVNVVQTDANLGDVDFTVSVDITILGCTDLVLQIIIL